MTSSTPFNSETCCDIEQLRIRLGSERLAEFRASLQKMDVRHLLARLGTTGLPVLVWELHLELDRRDIPPCARYPARDETPALEYVTWLADLFWLAKRNPLHETAYQSWTGLFSYALDSKQWHKLALWRYIGGKKSTYYIRGIGLTDVQRRRLLFLQSEKSKPARRLLRKMGEYVADILADANRHPDKSGVKTPKQVATDRAQILKCYLMAGGTTSLATELLAQIFDRTISRPFFIRQMAKIKDVINLRQL